MRNILKIISISTIFANIIALPVLSYSPFLDEAEKKYNISLKCQLCHINVNLNSFGQEFKVNWIKNKKNIIKTFEVLEKNDSDNDGFSNYEEIISNSFPGDKVSVPKLEPQKSH